MPKPDDKQPAAALTDFELRCLCLCASGFSDQEIGGIMGRSSATTRICFENILAKTKAKSRPHAIVLAMKVGAIKLDDLPFLR